MLQFLFVLSLLAPVGAAIACDSVPLLLDFPADDSAKSPVSASFTLDGKTLRVHFDVTSDSVNGKPKLGAGEYPYMFDVSEVFVSAEGGLPYYEFELTPFNQTLQVKIIDLKHPFVNNVNMGLESKAARRKGGWSTDFAIPLDRLGWQGDPAKIVGNAYAILDRKPSRHYYVRSPLPAQEKPNFHVPDAFKPLLNCSP
ncbi:MAG: hypothetical protein ACXVCK_20785 [Bdellovibrionota bacterium]